MSEKMEFFDGPSSLDKNRSRGDNVRDVVEFANEELYKIEQATRPGTRYGLEDIRKSVAELRSLVDAIDDEICERDEHGSRKDGGQ